MATAVAVATSLWPTVPASGNDFVFVNLEREDSWQLALSAAPLSAQLDGPQMGIGVGFYPQETSDY